MKKLMLLLLTLVMLVSLTACGKDSEKETTGSTESSGLESQPSESETQSSNGTTGSATQPSEPVTQPSEPATQPSEPATQPSEPATQPTEPPHTHSYSQSVTAPDCTNGGYTTNTCACGDSYRSDEKAALGHSWTDATCTAPKTCTVCKVTEDAAKGHSWTEATCTVPKTCSVCKATDGAAKGHSFAGETCSVCGEADPNFKALNTGCWEYRDYPNGNVVRHTFFFGTTAYWENSWHYYYCQPASAEQVNSAKEEGGIDVEKYRHENGNYYLYGEGDSGETKCNINGNVITVKVYSCVITLERTAGNQLTVTAVDGDLLVGSNGIKVGYVFTWRECQHNFNEGKCSSCGAIQENYKPLNSGKWHSAFVGEDGMLYNLNMWFQDNNKMISCSYGAELSTLDPAFQADLLAHPESLTEFEGKKYYIGMGDGMDITVDGGDFGGFFEVPGFSPEDASTKVYFERIAGDQIKIINVEGSVFGRDAVKRGMILTWREN